MSAKFIKLHSAEDGSPMWVNVAHVIKVASGPWNPGGETTYLDLTVGAVRVQETVNEVLSAVHSPASWPSGKAKETS